MMPTTINISAPTMLKIGAETIESANASPNAMAMPLPKLPERQSPVPRATAATSPGRPPHNKERNEPQAPATAGHRREQFPGAMVAGLGARHARVDREDAEQQEEQANDIDVADDVVGGTRHEPGDAARVGGRVEMGRAGEEETDPGHQRQHAGDQ